MLSGRMQVSDVSAQEPIAGAPPFALRVAVAVASAFLLSALVAPWGYYRLHWVAYLPMLWTLRRDTPRQNLWLALIYGTVAEALIFSWIPGTITLFSNLPVVVAWAVHALFAAVFGCPYFFVFGWLHRWRDRMGGLWILVLPAWLVVVEWLTMVFILFPYNQGVSQYREPWVWQIASVTGVWGVSWLVLFFNAAFAEGIFRAREGRPFPVRWAGAAVGVLMGVVGFGAWRYAMVEAYLTSSPVKHFFQVQSDHTMIYRLTHPKSETFGFWTQATSGLQPGEADVLVWPEGASPYDLNVGTAIQLLWDLADDKQVDFIVGSGTRERDPDPSMDERQRVRIFNSVYFLSRTRRRLGEEPATVVGDLAALEAGGCDLDRGHVFTVMEAFALSELAAQQASACAEPLSARLASMRENSSVDDEALRQLAADESAWSMLRMYTAVFDAPLAEDWFRRSRGEARWHLREAGCETGDCRFISARCSKKDCDVYPEAPHYDKMVPLPFGEYLPLAETFPWLATVIQGPGNFRAGVDPVVFDADGLRIATPICYEGILGYVCDDYVGSDILVNVTNDAWFGSTAASDLHGMLVAVRAIELGKPIFRSAYSGVSFVVEPHGRIHDETELFKKVSRVVDVRLGSVWTLYSVLGDWFVALCMLVVATSLWRTRGRGD